MPRFEIFKLVDGSYIHINPDYISSVVTKKDAVWLFEAGDGDDSHWEVKEDLIAVLRKLEGSDEPL